jgi:hypothetical protein
MSQAEARSWWADVEHLREAAERRQAAEAGRRPTPRGRAAEGGTAAPRRAVDEAAAAEARARARAAARVQEAGAGQVDEFSARRAVALDERTTRPRRPVPIWLADDEFTDPVSAARARAAAPRRTVEIRGQLVATVQPREPLGVPETRPARRPRDRRGSSLGAVIAGRPDRVAFWAFALGLALALAAALTSH